MEAGQESQQNVPTADSVRSQLAEKGESVFSVLDYKIALYLLQERRPGRYGDLQKWLVIGAIFPLPKQPQLCAVENLSKNNFVRFSVPFIQWHILGPEDQCLTEVTVVGQRRDQTTPDVRAIRDFPRPERRLFGPRPPVCLSDGCSWG